MSDSVAGAIQYLNSATLANKQGRPAIQNTLMNNMAIDILDVARSSAGSSGIGLSARARALNQQFLQQTTSNYNAIFGMSTIKTSSIENIQMQIKAIRASLPQSQIAESLRDPPADSADTAATDSSVGTKVDQSA